MDNHLYKSVAIPESKEPITFERMKHLLKIEGEGKTVDLEIRDEIPLNTIGESTDQVLLNGAEELMLAYEAIDAKKIDIVESLENVKYEGFNDKNEIILSFPQIGQDDRLTGSGIYDFTRDFLKSNFKLYDYVTYCLEKGFRDVVRDNIEEMINKHPSITKQYRLIDKNDELKIRAMTSNVYKNYDNNIVIYLTIIYLHKYAIENDTVFKLESGHLSDSELRLFFQKQEPIIVDGVGEIYIGLFVANSEIKDKAFTFELRYKVVKENGTKEFGMLPKISDALVNVRHNARVDTAFTKMENLKNIDKKHKKTIMMIEEIKKIDKLNPDQIYSFFERIKKDTDLNTATKDNFREYYRENLVDKTIEIIELLSETSELAPDIDQRIMLERIYYKVIIDLLES